MSKIENELLDVTAVVMKKKEDRQKYLTRVMLAVSKLPDPDWEGLSTEAQDWTNAAAEEHKAGAKLEDFPDLDEPEEDDNPPMDEEVDEEEETPVPTKTKKEAKPEKVNMLPQGTGKKISACHMIKKIVVKKPTITVAELSAQLKADGLKVSDVTIATLRSDLRDTLRVLNELGIGEFVLS